MQQIQGYLHVQLENLEIDGATEPIHAKITLGEIAQVDSTSRKSGSNFHEVFLIEVPKDPSRLAIFGYSGETKKGECRYDVNPFFGHEGSAHTIESQLFNDENIKVGKVKLKITFYSSRYGKLKVRIFHLELTNQMTSNFKEGKVKVRVGVHAQSTAIQPFDQQFDQQVEVLVLSPTMNLSFDIIHVKGLVASYTIKNLEESKILLNEAKAYQVSVFNNETPVGLIKYKLEWIKNKQ